MTYGGPLIQQISVPNNVGYTLTTLAIQGGQDFILTGTNFGPDGYIPAIRYGYKTSQTVQRDGANLAAQYMYVASNCRKDPTTPHTRMTCTTVRGMGPNLRTYITTAAVTAEVAFDNVRYYLTYARPNVTSISGPGAKSGDTEGSIGISLAGYNLCLQGSFGDPLYTNTAMQRASFFSITYGPTTGTEYIMRSCSCASEMPNVVNCVTSPGIGKNLLMRVSASGSGASVVTNAVSYGAPVITGYTRLDNASIMQLPTTGGVRVRITGRNFGASIDTTRFRAAYETRIRQVATEFGTVLTTDRRQIVRFNVPTSQCTMTTPHRELTCTVGSGAGTDLIWNLMIGFQNSSLPTTSYGQPQVLGLTNVNGGELNDANTEGGDVVVIRGRNFGPGEAANINCNGLSGSARMCSGYVQSLRFGATGSEFLFPNFTVKAHDTIWGWLPPGYGNNLRVTVQVADQVSEVNTTVGFSFATPTILSVSPLSGPTSSTIRTVLTITGRNWGLLDPTSTVAFAIGNPADGTAYGPLLPLTSFPDPADPASIARFRALPASQRISSATLVLPSGLMPGRAVRAMTYPSGTSDITLRVYSDAVRDSANSQAANGGADRTRFNYNTPSITGHLLQTFASYSASVGFQTRTSLQTVMRAAWPSTTDQANVKVLQLLGSDFGPAQSVRNDNVTRIVEGIAAANAGSGAWTADDYVLFSWDHATIVILTLVNSGTVRLRLIGSTFEGSSLVVTSNERPFSGQSPQITRVISPTRGYNTTGGEILAFEVQYLGVTNAQLAVTVGNRTCTWLKSDGTLITDPAAAAQEFVKGATSLATYSTLADGANEQERLWQLRCRTPANEGRGRPIIVRRDDEYSATTTTVDYMPPRITAFSVDGVRTPYSAAGGANGNRIVLNTAGSSIVIEGTNFGLCPQVQIGGNFWSVGDASICPGYPRYVPAFTELSHSRLAFTSPEGEGGVTNFRLAQPPMQSGFGAQQHDNFYGYTGGNGQVFGTLHAGWQVPAPMTVRYANPTVTSVTPYGHTAGGDVIQLTGTNFGVGTPRVLLGSVLACDDVNRTSHTALSCTLPEGQGANLTVNVIVANQTTDVTARGHFSYYAPSIAQMVIDGVLVNVTSDGTGIGGATVGGYNVTLLGSDFGAYDPAVNCLFIAWRGRDRMYRSWDAFDCDNKLGFVGEGELPAWTVTEWTHSRITFLFPPGAGLREVIPFQTNQGPSTPVVWRYAAPAITAQLEPQLGETTGGDLLTMRGHNFGRRSLSFANPTLLAAELARPLPATLEDYLTRPSLPQEVIKIEFFRSCSSNYFDAAGNRPLFLQGCNSTSILAHNDSTVQFFSSPGIGVNRTVFVTVIDFEPPADNPTGSPTRQVEIRSNAALFSYLPPIVTQVRPRPVKMAPRRPGTDFDNEGPITYPLTMYGRNFGRKPAAGSGEYWTDDESYVGINVGGIECLNAGRDYVGIPRRDVLTCDLQESYVGYNNITYNVAGQVGFTDNMSAAAVFVACDAGYFGRPGEFCLPCPWQDAVPPGALCEGFNDQLIVEDTQSEVDGGTHTYPRPLAGYYDLNGTEAGACPAEFVIPGRDTCVVPCEPVEACLGDNVCAHGYRSKAPMYRCASCDIGFYRRANECVKCPDSPYMLIIGMIALVIIVAGGAYVLNKKKINIAFVSIAIDFFQVRF